jgi:lysophospholipase L1-like esterase
MRRRAIGTLSIAVVAVGMTLAMGPAQRVAASGTSTDYYISLGDSLSVGFQPTSAHPNGQVTNNGYADQLEQDIQGRWGNHPVTLQKLGCPGETTESMINGATVPADDNYGPSFCSSQYSAASGGAFTDQLDVALAQIQADGANNVKVITIDIGANDAQGPQTGAANGNTGPECDGQNGTPNGVIDFGPMVAGQAADGTMGWGPPILDTACLTNGASTVNTNLPNIMSALRSAAPHAIIRGMNYYDPFLWVYAVANHDFGGGPCGGPCVSFAEQTQAQTNFFNKNVLKPAYLGAQAKVADVYDTFQTGNYNPDAQAGSTPTNVEDICVWTFMCDPTFGPNIHATTPGYSAIAGTFSAMIRPGKA